jgi:glycosyltransferase involved in cell wall biosynthesis
LGEKNRAELDLIYRQADVFVLTSDYEGWGMAAIEAAGCGLPIIMTDVGCAGEVFIDQKSAVIIPAGDKKFLIKAMREMMEDQIFRQKISEGAGRAIMNLPGKEETFALYKKSWGKAMGR